MERVLCLIKSSDSPEKKQEDIKGPKNVRNMNTDIWDGHDAAFHA